MSNAKDYQVGGDHYKRFAFQPWDIVDEYNLNFYAGCVLKYLLRYQYKNGLEDLKKARHFLDRLIEVDEKKQERYEEWKESYRGTNVYVKVYGGGGGGASSKEIESEVSPSIPTFLRTGLKNPNSSTDAMNWTRLNIEAVSKNANAS